MYWKISLNIFQNIQKKAYKYNIYLYKKALKIYFALISVQENTFTNVAFEDKTLFVYNT